MKILIFEGIATSGKSSIISALQKTLTGSKILVVSEPDTHEPIMDKTDDKHLEFFRSLIRKSVAKNPDLLIFDRLYITQALRSKSGLVDYIEIEKLLSQYASLTIFLKVDEATIHDRISKSAKHRGIVYFKSKGNTPEEIAPYYIDQQRNLLILLKQSMLPYQIIDTTSHNYEQIVEDVLRKYEKAR